MLRVPFYAVVRLAEKMFCRFVALFASRRLSVMPKCDSRYERTCDVIVVVPGANVIG